MLLTLLLEAHNYGDLVYLVEGLLVAVILVGLLIWLWSKRIAKQFNREQEQEVNVSWTDRLIAYAILALGLIVLWLKAIN